MLVILVVNVCAPPNLKHVAICADNTAAETILSTKLNTPLTIAPIPKLINCDCNELIAVVFVDVSACTLLKAVVVAYFISHEPTVAIWSVLEITAVACAVSIQSVI